MLRTVVRTSELTLRATVYLLTGIECSIFVPGGWREQFEWEVGLRSNRDEVQPGSDLDYHAQLFAYRRKGMRALDTMWMTKKRITLIGFGNIRKTRY